MNKHSQHLLHPIALLYLLLGLGQMFILPPFEGVDERMNYSSIRQIADTWRTPVYAESFIANEVIDYAKHGPMPYALSKPYEQNGSMSYLAFHTSTSAPSEFLNLYRSPQIRQSFTSSEDINWQSQHPPLYYILMAPIMWATDFLPFLNQFFTLRLFSFLMALTGLFIGIRETFNYINEEKQPYVFAALAIYPIMAPQFFPEFARLGNDALCLLLVGVIWSLFLRWIHDEKNLTLSLKIGFCFGIGFLTKAFFLPFIAGFAAFMAFRIWLARYDKNLRQTRLHNLIMLLVPALAASGWYFYKYWVYGEFSGAAEYIAMKEHGVSIFHPLYAINLQSVFVGMMTMWSSWSWGGTASLTVLPELFHLPLLGFSLWLAIHYLLELRQTSWIQWQLMPLLLTVTLYLALFHHALSLIALTGNPDTPAWYFNILTPLFAVAIALGLEHLNRTTLLRITLYFLVAYALSYTILVNWSQAAMFAGCATPNEYKFYQFNGPSMCFDQADMILARLSITGWPWASAACYALGFGLLARILVVSLKQLPTQRKQP